MSAKTWTFAILAMFGCLACSSLDVRRQPEHIQAALLRLTPLGSTPEEVMAIVKKEGWRTTGYNDRTGFLKQDVPPDKVVGVSSIRASLGDYPEVPIGTTNATAFWGFDKDRRLIEIWVWKTTDSL